MSRRFCLATLLSLAVAGSASAAVEWMVARGGGAFTKILAQQTGTNAVKVAGPNTLVFHLGKDKFVESLNLDFTGMHPYGYYMVKRGNDIALVGPGGDGSAYACMDFLKRYTGYRSFGGGPFGEVIPKIDKLDLPAEFTIREEPDVASVCIAGNPYWGRDFARSMRRTCISTHAMSDLVPAKLFAEHPEYFPMIDGKRTDPKSGAPWNPCMSNPDLADLVRAYAARYFKKNPTFVGLPLGVNDGGGDCCCEKCRALLAKHGNQYLEFYNLAAKVLAKDFPGKLVAFIAYNACSRPPYDGLKMEPNILVEKTGDANALLEWRKVGIRHFGNYQYLYGLNDCRMTPACYTHVIADYLRDYHKTYGLTTFWQELYPDSMIFDAGRQYVVNELLWNMNADVEALLDDYHKSMFGAAAKAMRKFSDTCEEAFKDNPERGPTNFFGEWMRPVQFNGYTFERIAACDAALKEAAAAVKPGSTEAWRISLITKVWSAMRLLMDSWACKRKLVTCDDAQEILRLARRGLADIRAFEAVSLTAKEESEAFFGAKPGIFQRWKALTNSAFAPLPPLEAGIDGALERLVGKLGREKAKAFLEPLAKDPELMPYAVTQLYLMDNKPVDLVVNGSFEETCEPVRGPDDDADWNPLGATGGWVWWKFPNTEARAFVDDSEAHTGKRSGVVTKSRYGCGIMNRWAAEPRTRYRLSCWVKTSRDRGRNNGDVCVRLKSGDGKWIDVAGSAITCPIPREAIGNWVELKLIFTTPDRDDGIFLVPLVSPDGSQTPEDRLWIDDVRLEKLCELPRAVQSAKPADDAVVKALEGTRGLVAYWDFAEAKPPYRSKGPFAAELSAGDGRGPVQVEGGPLSGRALRFGGKNYLTLPYAKTGALNVKSNQVTVVAWVKWTRGQIGFVGGMWNEYQDGGKRQYGLFVSLPHYNGANQVCGHISKKGGPTPHFPYSLDYSASAQEVPDRQWCCVAFTYDGADIRSYLDGRFEARAPEKIAHTAGFLPDRPEGLVHSKNPYHYPDGIGDNGSDFTVGAVRLKNGMGNFFRGDIGGLAVFDRALTDEELLRLSGF